MYAQSTAAFLQFWHSRLFCAIICMTLSVIDGTSQTICFLNLQLVNGKKDSFLLWETLNSMSYCESNIFYHAWRLTIHVLYMHRLIDFETRYTINWSEITWQSDLLVIRIGLIYKTDVMTTTCCCHFHWMNKVELRIFLIYEAPCQIESWWR